VWNCSYYKETSIHSINRDTNANVSQNQIALNESAAVAAVAAAIAAAAATTITIIIIIIIHES